MENSIKGIRVNVDWSVAASVVGGKVKVSPEDLKAKAEEAMKRIENYRTALNNMAKQMEGSNAYWKGKGGDAFRNDFRTKKAQLDQAIKELDNYPKELLKYEGIYSEVVTTTTQAAESINELNLF